MDEYGKDNLVVILGAPDADSAELYAETVMHGDPSWAGPLAGVALDLTPNGGAVAIQEGSHIADAFALFSERINCIPFLCGDLFILHSAFSHLGGCKEALV